VPLHSETTQDIQASGAHVSHTEDTTYTIEGFTSDEEAARITQSTSTIYFTASNIVCSTYEKLYFALATFAVILNFSGALAFLIYMNDSEPQLPYLTGYVVVS